MGHPQLIDGQLHRGVYLCRIPHRGKRHHGNTGNDQDDETNRNSLDQAEAFY